MNGNHFQPEEAELRLLIEQIKGKLALVSGGKEQLGQLLGLYQTTQDALNRELKKRLDRQENCPCQVRRDPSCECPLASIRLVLARYVGIGVGAGFLFQVMLQIAIHFVFTR
jgi:hypothetical protein